MNALAYYDGYRSERLPANFLFRPNAITSVLTRTNDSTVGHVPHRVVATAEEAQLALRDEGWGLGKPKACVRGFLPVPSPNPQSHARLPIPYRSLLAHRSNGRRHRRYRRVAGAAGRGSPRPGRRVIAADREDRGSPEREGDRGRRPGKSGVSPGRRYLPGLRQETLLAGNRCRGFSDALTAWSMVRASTRAAATSK